MNNNLIIVNKGKYCLDEPKQYYNFKFKPDHFQLWGMNAINKGHNLFCCAHTGSGKTVLAQHAIFKALQEGKQAIYASPIITLSNQKFKEFQEDFEKYDQDNVGILTGDSKINPTAKILIMTAEILRNALERKSDEEVYEWNFNPDKIGCVVLDEVHYINNPDRGKVWEDIIINLNPNINLIMLSATINGAENLVKWISSLKNIPCNLVSTEKRPVPLQHKMFLNDKFVMIMDDDKWCDGEWNKVKKASKKYFYDKRTKSNIPILFKCLKKLIEKEELPVTVFLLNKKMVENIAKKMPFSFETDLTRIKTLWFTHLNKYEEIYKHSEQWLFIKSLVFKGIGIHHRGILPMLREIVEIMYGEKLLSVLIATETFAMGVNMPTKTTIFPQLTKWDGKGRRNLKPDEYTQMAGRAGRRGLDEYGNVILIPEYDLIEEWEARKMLMSPPQKVESKFSIDYSYILKKLIFRIENNIDIPIIDYLRDSIKKSYLNKEQDIFLNNLLKQKDNLKINKDIEFDDYQDIFNQYIEKEEHINNSQKKLIKLSNKKRKKIKREMIIIKEQIPERIFKKLENQVKKQNELQKLEKEIEYHNIKYNNQIEKVMEFLIQENLLDEKYNLSRLGRIVAEVNECNPLLLGYILNNKILNKLEFSEIIALLSTFIKDDSNNEIRIKNLEISDNLKELMYNLSDYANKLYDYENKINHSLPFTIWSKWDLYLNLFIPSKLWAEGKQWVEIKANYDSYEGNFVKNILRLTNLIRNIVVIAKITNNFELLTKLDNFEEKLIRDFVRNDSLYL
jgi:superfamily II RNA helicase